MSLEKYGLSEKFDSSKMQEFGTEFLTHFLEGGWGSLPKKDFESLIYILLEKNDAIASDETNYGIARKLRITESKAASLRRESYARWHMLAPLNSKSLIRDILENELKPEKIEKLKSYVTDEHRKSGFMPILLEHPVKREEFIFALKQINAVPKFERNREVILIQFGDIFSLAQEANLVSSDLEKGWEKLKEHFKDDPSIQSFLNRNIKDLNNYNYRGLFNKLGAQIVEGGIVSITINELLKFFGFH